MSDRLDINHVYDILGLKPGASADEVKQAYRQMAKTWHPDCFFEPQQKLEAEEKIKEINQAYARLKSYQPDETNQSASTFTKIDLTPSSAEGFYKLGMEKAQKGKYTEAIEHFTQAIRLNPNYFEAYKYRGLACSKSSGSYDQTIKLWNINTGKLVNTLAGHRSYICAIAFSPDGQHLASGSADHTVKLWDVNTGQNFSTLDNHSDWVNSVAFSPDGKTLVSGSRDMTIKLWRCDI